MKRILQLIVILLLPLFCLAQGFTTNNSNGNLLDANGNNFIMKGMNVPTAWFVNDVNSNIANVRNNTGANCLRIVVSTTSSDNSWQTTVQNCINNNMIPMVELHDVTGSTSAAALNQMAQFWASKASYLTKPEIAKYILINIVNEWGTWQTATDDANNPNGGAWLSAFTTAIKTIRDAGIKTTLVIDAVGYGQDRFAAKNIRDDAKTMMASDASFLKGQANLLFSIHMYCEWRKGGDDIAIIGTIKNAGIPIIVGEFGYQHATDGSCDIDEQRILDQCQQYGIGWLAWSQKGNGSPVQYLDLCDNWSCSSLSNWGNTVVNGKNGSKTSVTASVFTTTNTTPTVAITSPTNNSTSCTGSDITISATAAVTGGAITKVDFYNGNTLIGTDNSSPYSFTWNKPAAGTYTLRAIATSSTNTTSTAATVSVVVASPTITPYSNVNDSEWLEKANVELCEGGKVMYGPHPHDVTTGWSWKGPNNFTATIREISFDNLKPSQAGTYTATFTNAAKCTTTANMVVAVNESPTIKITSPLENEVITTDPATITITTTTAGKDITTVQFYNGSTLLGQTTTAPYQFVWNNILDGNYTITARATDVKNCVGNSVPVSMEVSKITGFEKDNYLIKGDYFPNPFQDQMIVRYAGNFDYSVYTSSGQVIEKGSANTSVELGKQLKTGLYLLVINSGNKTETIKITKQ